METNKDFISFLRTQFPEGTRIKLNEMKDPYAPVPPGTTGTLVHIDDAGTFHMKWDNGRTLGLIPGEDDFMLLPLELTTLKLYMPLSAQVFDRTEWNTPDNEGSLLGGISLLKYESEISNALKEYRMPEEAERGIMHWYDQDDSLAQKVSSVVFTAEPRNGALWGVADCRIQDNLTPDEMVLLKNYITGQASDGWGEGFEQQGIEVGNDELFVSLWTSNLFWSLQTEEELDDPQKAYILDDGSYYFAIQTCDDGYDYTLYNSDFSENDGGQLDEPDWPIDYATEAILDDFGLVELERERYDYDLLAEQTELYEIEQFSKMLDLEPSGDFPSLEDRIQQAAYQTDPQPDNEVPPNKDKER